MSDASDRIIISPMAPISRVGDPIARALAPPIEAGCALPRAAARHWW